MDFKERLKELRKRKGLSQVALSERLGLSKSTIGAYETGDITPSLEALNSIAELSTYLSSLVGNLPTNILLTDTIRTIYNYLA